MSHLLFTSYNEVSNAWQLDIKYLTVGSHYHDLFFFFFQRHDSHIHESIGAHFSDRKRLSVRGTTGAYKLFDHHKTYDVTTSLASMASDVWKSADEQHFLFYTYFDYSIKTIPSQEVLREIGAGWRERERFESNFSVT